MPTEADPWAEDGAAVDAHRRTTPQHIPGLWFTQERPVGIFLWPFSNFFSFLASGNRPKSRGGLLPVGLFI